MVKNLRSRSTALLLVLIACGTISCEDSLVPKPTSSIGARSKNSSGQPTSSATPNVGVSPLATSSSLSGATPSLSVGAMPNFSLTPAPLVSGSPRNGANQLMPSQNSSQSSGSTYQVINEQLQPQFTIDGRRTLHDSSLPLAQVTFQPQALLTVLQNTRNYLKKNANQDPVIAQPGVLATQGVTGADTLRTLDFAIETLQADIQANRSLRLQDAAFIQKNFRVVKWRAQNPQKADQEQIRITKYAVFTHPGAKTKTAIYNTALYSLKDPRAKAAPYSKQEVLAGIYEPGGKAAGAVEPIAYLTRDGLEEALMEGTILIKFTDGTQGFFNVDRSNEIPYIKGLDRKAQKRYWYFQQVNKIKGYGYNMAEKIEVEPGVTFAGDVLNIGLGKLVAVGNGQNLRLGVVADTGGAFLPNLHQLDFLAGVFANKDEFQRAARSVPEYANAYFLIKK
jgi:hypothetical protein